MIANAFSGTGGQINITANNAFNFELASNATEIQLRQNASNDISASSQFGNSGTITLDTIDVDPAESLSELPTDLIDASGLIDQSLCAIGNKSEFVVTGRGGLPTAPTDTLNAASPWEDWDLAQLERDRPPTLPLPQAEAHRAPAAHNAQAQPLIEARHWAKTSSGIVLYAAAPTAIQRRSPQCRQLRYQLGESNQ